MPPLHKSLPQPDADALAHSEKLTQRIKQVIQQEGAINFARFMEMALYEPGLGYYMSGAQKIGATGDFITAPELSNLFGACVAEPVAAVIEQLKTADILEIGAGTGKLAADILQTLAQKDRLPAHYYILELSADLRERQKRYLQEQLPALFPLCVWLDQLPAQPLQGVILANEVLDALPVRAISLQQEWQEIHITCVNDQLTLESRPADAAVKAAVAALNIDFTAPYQTEINLNIAPWLVSLTASLQAGAILLMDYGFPQREYYHPSRDTGTLMCHYRHHAHTDPLLLIGLQDITAHVDFTAVAKTASALGLTLAGYTTQAHFLLNCGLLTLAEKAAGDATQQWRVSQAIKRLLFPSEMGELFKVIAFTQALTLSLPGFQQHDKRDFL